MSKEKMVEVESGPKAARGMESPRKRSAELPDSPGLEAGNPIPAAAARKNAGWSRNNLTWHSQASWS